MTEKKKEITRGKDVWRTEIKALKQRMPRDYRKRLIASNPEYDSLEGADLIRNFWDIRTMDIVLRRIFEKIADDYQLEQDRASQDESQSS